MTLYITLMKGRKSVFKFQITLSVLDKRIKAIIFQGYTILMLLYFFYFFFYYIIWTKGVQTLCKYLRIYLIAKYHVIEH